MATQTKIRADLSKLESLLKEIGGEFVARVGVIGSAAGEVHDTESGLTNAEIGLINEFGSSTNNIPPRSFLRMPLETQQDKLMDVLDTGSVKESIESGDIKQVYKTLGIAAEQIVKDAFLTGGFGNWKANAPITIHGGWMSNKNGKSFYVKGKGTDKPLIDTGALMRSISSDVVKRSDL